MDICRWRGPCLFATGIDLDGFCVGTVVEGSGVLGAEMKKAPDTWRHFN